MLQTVFQAWSDDTSQERAGRDRDRCKQEERERRKAKKALEELREFLISEAEIAKRFVDGKNLLLLDAEGVKCMDSLARFARLKRFDECSIADLSKDRIRYALNRRFVVPQPAELRYLSRFRT